MRPRKLPEDAFILYLALGPCRSYQTIAEHYGVSKTAVVNRAVKQGWQKKVEDFEEKAMAIKERKLFQAKEDMDDRHIKVAKAIQGKALETLKVAPLKSGMEAVRALDIAVKQERLVRGEPTERTVMETEQVIRDEYAALMRVVEEEYTAERKEGTVDGNGDKEENEEAS